MRHAIPVFIAIFLCLAAAFVVSWDLWPLISPALAAVHAETLAEARARHDSMLRARFVRTARPDGPPLIPASGAARCRPGSAGLPNLDHILPALSAKLEAARTRDDLKVIHAGGMLLPDRPRTVYEPGPFRIPPYYLAYEAEQAERRYLA